MKQGRRTRRRVVDLTVRGLMVACVVIALIPLISILATTVERGAGVISWHFLTSGEPIPCTPTPATPTCSYGGMAPAIEGSFIMLAVAALIAMPLGILAGIYLAEFGQHRVGRTASFIVDVLSGVPSIIVGVFVYTLFYLLSSNPENVYSAFSGSFALAVIMLPVVVRTTEESLRLVPHSVREAAAALGIPRYKTTLRIVLPTGGAAIVTGAILATARAGGEAAPLLLTAFGNRLGFIGFDHPAEAIPPLIYAWGTSGYENWVADAWGMALVLIAIMLSLSLTARLILARRARLIGGSG
jgi:phosphate transport system permease protein